MRFITWIDQPPWNGLVPIVILVAIVVIDILFFTLWSHWFRDPATTATTVATVSLVGVTGLYGWHTREMAKASREQAKASQQLAKQTERQLHHSVRPILQFTEDASLPTMYMGVVNIGLGPALNVRCWVAVHFPNGKINCYNTDNASHIFQRQVLGRGDRVGDRTASVKWQMTVVHQITDIDKVSLFAVYQDTYDNFFVSESRYPKVGDTLKAGDFNVNELNKEKAKALLKETGFRFQS